MNSEEPKEQRTFEENMARLLAMDDETWARHANPWSVWTRFTALPLLTLAIWSRVWIGTWAWTAIAAAVLWIWLNPRVFKKPQSLESWPSKAVLGERIWLNRKRIPVPAHHRLTPNIAAGVAGLGLPPLAWGLWQLELWPIACAFELIYVGKVWFLDRMVWLFEDVRGGEGV